MGFFNKPFKATKAFIHNPAKVIKNDVNNIFGKDPPNPSRPSGVEAGAHIPL